MTTRSFALVCTFSLTLLCVAQQPAQVPDAPSATRPTPFPADTKPAPKEPSNRPQPVEERTPRSDQPTPAPENPQNPTLDQEGIPTFPVTVNRVTVPVMVKDGEVKTVFGLLRNDFTVLEDGQEQNVTYFSSDPVAMSAAVVIDQGMSDTAMRKINASLDSIAASFAPYDEVALY